LKQKTAQCAINASILVDAKLWLFREFGALKGKGRRTEEWNDFLADSFTLILFLF
jgi:hypothetical protein